MCPKLLDYSEQECKQMLRTLELEAYSTVVSALRAQGEFSAAKKKLLQDLSSILSIRWERYQAELRRAVNDEKLTTIAYHISGDANCKDWVAEGRRTTPLMSRLLPQTSSTNIANMAATIQCKRNEAKSSNNTEIKAKRNHIHSGEASTHSNTNFKRPKIGNGVSHEHAATVANRNGTQSSSISVSHPRDVPVQSSPINVTAKTSPTQPLQHQIITNLRPGFQLASSLPNNSPRVVFVSSNGTSVPGLSSSNEENKSNENSNIKLKIIQNSHSLDPTIMNSNSNSLNTSNQVIKTVKPLTAIVSNNGSISGAIKQAMSMASEARMSAKTIPQQVVVIPSGTGQQKTITLPISQALKGLQVPAVSGSGGTTVLYQTATMNAGTLKAIPGTITIQTFKPNQGNKVQTPNLIIVPAPKGSTGAGKALSIGTLNSANLTGAQAIRVATGRPQTIALEQLKVAPPDEKLDAK
ncbi:uncharacterized protein LOC141855628 [Brevipalpus obovatus]|uniref:uncharacterized protein LOC141855628 n=1 Tax=Brevipalpus obovatus TaxID=246614 RepID=UPI003D9EA726